MGTRSPRWEVVFYTLATAIAWAAWLSPASAADRNWINGHQGGGELVIENGSLVTSAAGILGYVQGSRGFSAPPAACFIAAIGAATVVTLDLLPHRGIENHVQN